MFNTLCFANQPLLLTYLNLMQPNANTPPFDVQSSQTVYENPWIRVHEDRFVRPDGQPGLYGVVQMKPGVSVLALDADHNAYLTQEYRYILGTTSVELVSGGIEPHETPIEAAQRELREELGIVADTWEPLGCINPFTAVVHSPAWLFVARGLRFEQATPDPGEDITLVKVPFAEAVSMVQDGRISHGASCVTILRVALAGSEERLLD